MAYKWLKGHSGMDKTDSIPVECEYCDSTDLTQVDDPNELMRISQSYMEKGNVTTGHQSSIVVEGQKP